MLSGIGLLVVLAIVMPPVFWLLSYISWVFRPFLWVFAWWWRLWGGAS